MDPPRAATIRVAPQAAHVGRMDRYPGARRRGLKEKVDNEWSEKEDRRQGGLPPVLSCAPERGVEITDLYALQRRPVRVRRARVSSEPRVEVRDEV